MKKIIGTISLMACLWACKKGSVTSPEFDVVADRQTIKANETVNFSFSGQPDFITFYSGEAGKQYANSARYSALGKATLEFSSSNANGSQQNTMALLVSTDFQGKGVDNSTTVSNIGKATWTNITSRAVLATAASTPSGQIDLTDFATANKPVYIAFKYTGASGSTQKKWNIISPKVTNTLSDGRAFIVADHTAAAISNNGNTNIVSPGWVSSNVLNTYNWTLSSATWSITGATSAALATAPAEAWLFSGPIDLQKTVPDFGTVIKDITNAAVPYAYTFKTAGTYKVTFVGTNNNVYGSKSQVRELTITVTP